MQQDRNRRSPEGPRRSAQHLNLTFVFLTIGAGLTTLLLTFDFSSGCSWTFTACIAEATCMGT